MFGSVKHVSAEHVLTVILLIFSLFHLVCLHLNAVSHKSQSSAWKGEFFFRVNAQE